MGGNGGRNEDLSVDLGDLLDRDGRRPAMMNRACKTSHHPWCAPAPLSGIQHAKGGSANLDLLIVCGWITAGRGLIERPTAGAATAKAVASPGIRAISPSVTKSFLAMGFLRRVTVRGGAVLGG